MAQQIATTKDPVSTLVYGVQWDATVTFLEKNYPGISSNSTEYENYGNSYMSTIKTGTNPNYAQNNIYDMCGNVLEFTMEYSTSYYILRGGYINGDNNGTVDGSRATRESPLVAHGFRIALCIK